MRVSPLVFSAAVRLAWLDGTAQLEGSVGPYSAEGPYGPNGPVGSYEPDETYAAAGSNDTFGPSGTFGPNRSFGPNGTYGPYEAMMTATTTIKTIGLARRSRTELSTEFFLIPDVDGIGTHSGASVASVISVPPPNRTISINHPTRNVGYAEEKITPVMPNGPYYQSILRDRPWALPLAALSAAVMLLMAVFEIFVLFKVNPWV